MAVIKPKGIEIEYHLIDILPSKFDIQRVPLWRSFQENSPTVSIHLSKTPTEEC